MLFLTQKKRNERAKPTWATPKLHYDDVMVYVVEVRVEPNVFSWASN